MGIDREMLDYAKPQPRHAINWPFNIIVALGFLVMLYLIAWVVFRVFSLSID